MYQVSRLFDGRIHQNGAKLGTAMATGLEGGREPRSVICNHGTCLSRNRSIPPHSYAVSSARAKATVPARHWQNPPVNFVNFGSASPLKTHLPPSSSQLFLLLSLPSLPQIHLQQQHIRYPLHPPPSNRQKSCHSTASSVNHISTANPPYRFNCIVFIDLVALGRVSSPFCSVDTHSVCLIRCIRRPP